MPDNNVLPIRADISPALRPEVLDRHAPVLTGRGARVLGHARQSLTTLCQQMALIHDFHYLSPVTCWPYAA